MDSLELGSHRLTDTSESVKILFYITLKVLCIGQSGVDRLPAFQDDCLSEQHYRQAGVAGQGSWGQGQAQSSAPWQSYYHYYPGTGGPTASEVTVSLYQNVVSEFQAFCLLVAAGLA